MPSRPTPTGAGWRSRWRSSSRFMGVEVVAGILASSLALLSDAAHMLTDAGAIALALVAARLAARPPGGALHVRPRPRGDPLGADQRRGAARARRRHRVGGRAAARRPARRRGRASSSRSALVGAVGERRRGVGAVARRAAEPERRGRDGARAHRPLRVARRGRVAGVLIAAHRLERVRRRRRAGRRRAHGRARAGGCCATPRACCSRPRPQGMDPNAIGHALAAAARRRRGPRPARLGGHGGLPGASPRTSLVAPDDDCHARRRELQALLARALRHPPHDAAGRPRGGRAGPARDRARPRR